MKKKILTMIASVVMVVTFVPTASFATESIGVQKETETLDSNEVAEFVEDIAGTDDVIEDIGEEDESFVMDGEDTKIIVSDDEVVLDCGEADEQISMSLPEEFNHMEGTLAGDGTIVYAEDDADAALAVQAVQEQQDGFCLYGFRSLVVIENAQAPHEYSFQFDLPEGAKLVQDGDYINIINENSIVTDENGENAEPEVLGVIEPAWAKDANGKSVNTYYTINGNTLNQMVDFDEGSAFPIVADPKVTPVKYYWKTISGTKYNKSTAANSTKKCVWTAKVYRHYYKNTGTGKLTFRYKSYAWSWKGYNKVNGSWKYVTSKSGTTTGHSGPDNLNDWYSYLANLGEF